MNNSTKPISHSIYNYPKTSSKEIDKVKDHDAKSQYLLIGCRR